MELLGDAIGGTIALFVVIAIVFGIVWALAAESSVGERVSAIGFWITVGLVVLLILAGIWLPVIL